VRLGPDDARDRFASARVARLATSDPAGQPHLVPIVFALAPGDVLYSAVDAKPKATTELRRLANIRANPRVAVLVDFYDEDWRRLWWVRADGLASVVPAEEAVEGLDLLASRYPAYRGARPDGAVVRVEISAWTGWSGDA
jgi:PPOX class probable F420-dependent enzyme